MSDFKNELIRLGSNNPDLRKHLKPVIAAVDANEMFGELRSAISRNDVAQIKYAVSKLYTHHKAFFEKGVNPYLQGILTKKIQALREGDMCVVHMFKSSAKVVVEMDWPAIRSEYPATRAPRAYVRKPRSKKQGSLYVQSGEVLYQATLMTQTERVYWIESM